MSDRQKDEEGQLRKLTELVGEMVRKSQAPLHDQFGALKEDIEARVDTILDLASTAEEKATSAISTAHEVPQGIALASQAASRKTQDSPL